MASWRWIIAILLAVVATHALVPHSEPRARATGSAFTADTDEVAIGPTARGDVQNRLVLQLGSPPPDTSPVFRDVLAGYPAGSFGSLLAAMLPPSDPFLFQLNPRAPPAV